VHEVERDGVGQVLDLAAESVGQFPVPGRGLFAQRPGRFGFQNGDEASAKSAAHSGYFKLTHCPCIAWLYFLK
jgi:hypothetical protein